MTEENVDPHLQYVPDFPLIYSVQKKPITSFLPIPRACNANEKLTDLQWIPFLDLDGNLMVDEPASLDKKIHLSQCTESPHPKPTHFHMFYWNENKHKYDRNIIKKINKPFTITTKASRHDFLEGDKCVRRCGVTVHGIVKIAEVSGVIWGENPICGSVNYMAFLLALASGLTL